MEKLQANVALQKIILFLNESLPSVSPKETIELFALKEAPEINKIQANDPIKFFSKVEIKHLSHRHSDRAEKRSSLRKSYSPDSKTMQRGCYICFI